MLKNIIIKYKGVILFTIGSLLIVLSIFLLLYQRIALQKEKVFSLVSSLIKENSNQENNEQENNIIESEIDVNTGYLDDNNNTNNNNNVDNGNNVVVSKEDIKISQDAKKQKEYIGYLEIPKISLKYGFVSKTSFYNNVNRNIQVLSISDFPDVDKGNFILAGHSGNSAVAYFAMLYKLKVGDVAKVTYRGNIYNYKIVSIYKEKKDGAVNIKRDVNKTTLTLITCSYRDRMYQTIYIASLEDVKRGG